MVYRAVAVVVSSESLYVLGDKFNGEFSVISALKLANITSVAVALNSQYLRVHQASGGIVLLTRSQSSTQAIVSAIIPFIRGDAVLHHRAATLATIDATLTAEQRTPPCMLYALMLRGKPDGTLRTRELAAAEPVTLIVTHDALLLCTDAYNHYPLDPSYTGKIPQQFKVLENRDLTDLAGVRFSSSHPSTFTLVFDPVANWQMTAVDSATERSILKQIAELWKEQFFLSLRDSCVMDDNTAVPAERLWTEESS